MFFRKNKINKALKKLENDNDVREELKSIFQKYKLDSLKSLFEGFEGFDNLRSLSKNKENGLFSFYQKNLPNKYNVQKLELFSKEFENQSNYFMWDKTEEYKILNSLLWSIDDFCVVINITKMNVEFCHSTILNKNHLILIDFNEISSLKKIHSETTTFAFEFMKYISNTITEDEFLNEVIKLSIQKYK